MRIEVGNLTSPDVQALLSEHLAGMQENSPPSAVYALNLDGLRAKSVTFWTVREDKALMGCGPFGDYKDNSFSIFMTIKL